MTLSVRNSLYKTLRNQISDSVQFIGHGVQRALAHLRGEGLR